MAQSGVFLIKNEEGLHARPAALFVQTAAQFEAKVVVKNKTRETDFVDAKSSLSVMGLAVSRSHRIEVRCEGVDEETALQTIRRLIESDFREQE